MARYYGVGTGRFTTADPYQASAGPADPGSWNRYVYTRGDPVNRIDLQGLEDLGMMSLFWTPIDLDAPPDITPGLPGGLAKGLNGDWGMALTVEEAEGHSPEFDPDPGGGDEVQQSGPCDDLASTIDTLINALRVSPSDFKGLAQKFRQMRGVPMGTLPGYIEQFRNRQKQLRNILRDWDNNDCGPRPPGATDWAEKPIPQEILNRIPSAPDSGAVTRVGVAGLGLVNMRSILQAWPVIFAF
jgi:hypothetical protein